MRIIIIIAIISCFAYTSYSQDIHFSQFSESPLTINPALTGATSCYRATVVHKEQWTYLAEPFITSAFSYDMKVLKYNKKGFLGLGVLMFNDRSGDGHLSNNTAHLSVAYHYKLNDKKNSRVSIGAQFGAVQKSIDFSNLYFENQFDDDFVFNQSMPHGESMSNDVLNYADLRTGLSYTSSVSENSTLNIGASFYHLLKPKESFLATSNELDQRFIVHSNLGIIMSPVFYLRPGVIFMNQSKNNEFLLGTSCSYRLPDKSNDKININAGVWMRFKDALVVSGGISFNNFRLGVSYDVNISKMKILSNGNGGIEVSLIYTNSCLPKIPLNISLPCKRL